MKNNTDLILDFLKHSRKMHTVYRQTPKIDGGFESDAEHSWPISLTCLMLMKELQKEFDGEIDELKVLKMAIIHDLAEVETGDTATWDMEARVGKEAKEKAAIDKISKDLPRDIKQEFLSLIQECEEKETLEAKIVKSIDRADPILHRASFGLGPDNIVEGHETIEALDSRQRPRHEFSKILTNLYENLREEAIIKHLIKTDQIKTNSKIHLNNKYITALKNLILFSAITHLVILFGYSIYKMEIVHVNYFNILDLDIIFPDIINGRESQVLSLIVVILLYIFFLKKNSRQ